MLILHGAWIPALRVDDGRFAVWAETAAPPPGKKGRPGTRPTGTVASHPFAAAAATIRDALGAESALLAGAESGECVAHLPSYAAAPVPSALGGTLDPGGEVVGLTTWMVEALLFDAGRANTLLVALAERERAPGLVRGDDLTYWITAAQFALDALCRQRVLPVIEADPDGSAVRWRLMLESEPDLERWRELARAMPGAGRALTRTAADELEVASSTLHDYLNAAADAVVRGALGAGRPSATPTKKVAATRPKLGQRVSTLQAAANTRARVEARAARVPHLAWLQALRDAPLLADTATAARAFQQTYRRWVDAGRPPAPDTFRVCFRLDPPEEAGAEEAPRSRNPTKTPWSIEYLLQATDDPSLLVPAAQVWRQRGATARFVNRRFDQPQERLLAGLGQASRLFPPLSPSLATATPERCALTTEQAHDFVRQYALLLKASGFGVLVPGLEAKVGVRVRLKGSAAGAAKNSATFSWDTVVAYDWQIAIGDETLSRAEFEALARLKEPLVRVRGRWIELRPEELERALAFFERHPDGQMGLQEAIQLAVAPDGQVGLPVLGVTTEGWLDDLLQQLSAPQARADVVEPPGFVGQLRPYQRVGVSWLDTLRRFGLGACLADDMGLGKTIQVIALQLHARATSSAAVGPLLLICPTSVVGNWRRELERFGPELRVLVHHGAERTRTEFAQAAAAHDVVISSYALLHRDASELSSVEWDTVVLDEAQNIKNPATRAAQAARALPGRWRVALTGTPIENRLTELWSIFQFLNPGYLGSGEEFRRAFAIPIERTRDATATSRLQSLIAPFMLRRLKTDRSIIADLPEKQEMKVFCTLTSEQATLYEAVVRDAMAQIETADGIQRRGQILATLTKLKQVCDHPALLLHTKDAADGRSGKLERLREMLEEVLAVGDRALIFTQYAEMGRILQSYLRETFGGEVLFLHGGTPAAERDRMVERFQAEGAGPAIFVLSLKAGGTGLTLTRANHVFHFDRWWNPAVENQATDRAFRIGQQRNVQVHKYICAGTFEEALDGLIEAKVELAQSIVGTSEAWITELSTSDLRDLFALRRDVAVA